MGYYQPMTASGFVGILVAAMVILIVATPVAIVIGLGFAILKVWELVQQSKTKEEPVATGAPEVPDEADATQERNAFRKHVDIGDAGIDVWFHPSKGVIKRTVRVRNKELVAKHGEKFNLPQLDLVDPDNVEEIVEQSVREVRDKFGIGTTVKAGTPERERKPRQKRAKATTSYTGEVIRYGMETHEGKTGQYESFTLHLFDTEAAAPHEMHGADLQRAIKEAGVVPGDQVKVEILGSTPVALGAGKTGNKTLWSVSKI